ncbi:MAG: bifunctional demethylmenaquinone methyltransferase/2-methoxy-6-polyprenyl-1,4-benzoquinol methylase UbiE [FCB group bacterium]|nr:bifunctional demethylmenaquinone methyltransferase/2-methoxy-6-polyprenyl-1,4-benzoquinol methylase UbiE [FCB group bacterium]
MDTERGHKIQAMFDRISPRYDLLNRLLSGGQDMRWRRKAVAMLGDLQGKTALDLCSGTGDFLQIFRELYGPDITLYGADFAYQMLILAGKRHKAKNDPGLVLCQADAMFLPFEDNSLDAVTIGFGIRNVVDRPKALKDILRTLRPGGKLVIIEPSIPKNRLIGIPFSFYFKHIMPFIGGLISGDRAAYKYLDSSVTAFPSPGNFVRLLKEAGFTDAKACPQLFGTAQIYFGEAGIHIEL